MRILVAAASKHGATMEIAEAIGRGLEEEDVSVTVQPVGSVTELAAFDAVILGSAVYMGRWLEPARAFADSNAETLRARPTWLFSSGPIGDPPRPDAEQAVAVDDLLETTGARAHRLFAGRLDRGRLGFGERAVMLAFRAEDGDYREWDEIAGWAREIAAAVRACAPDRAASGD
jgi:menaquinone-dependent protoporphyrinogen oxidase